MMSIFPVFQFAGLTGGGRLIVAKPVLSFAACTFLGAEVSTLPWETFFALRLLLACLNLSDRSILHVA